MNRQATAAAKRRLVKRRAAARSKDSSQLKDPKSRAAILAKLKALKKQRAASAAGQQKPETRPAGQRTVRAESPPPAHQWPSGGSDSDSDSIDALPPPSMNAVGNRNAAAQSVRGQEFAPPPAPDDTRDENLPGPPPDPNDSGHEGLPGPPPDSDDASDEKLPGPPPDPNDASDEKLPGPPPDIASGPAQGGSESDSSFSPPPPPPAGSVPSKQTSSIPGERVANDQSPRFDGAPPPIDSDGSDLSPPPSPRGVTPPNAAHTPMGSAPNDSDSSSSSLPPPPAGEQARENQAYTVRQPGTEEFSRGSGSKTEPPAVVARASGSSVLDMSSGASASPTQVRDKADHISTADPPPASDSDSSSLSPPPSPVQADFRNATQPANVANPSSDPKAAAVEGLAVSSPASQTVLADKLNRLNNDTVSPGNASVATSEVLKPPVVAINVRGTSTHAECSEPARLNDATPSALPSQQKDADDTSVVRAPQPVMSGDEESSLRSEDKVSPEQPATQLDSSHGVVSITGPGNGEAPAMNNATADEPSDKPIGGSASTATRIAAAGDDTATSTADAVESPPSSDNEWGWHRRQSTARRVSMRVAERPKHRPMFTRSELECQRLSALRKLASKHRLSVRGKLSPELIESLLLLKTIDTTTKNDAHPAPSSVPERSPKGAFTLLQSFALLQSFVRSLRLLCSFALIVHFVCF